MSPIPLYTVKTNKWAIRGCCNQSGTSARYVLYNYNSLYYFTCDELKCDHSALLHSSLCAGASVVYPCIFKIMQFFSRVQSLAEPFINHRGLQPNNELPFCTEVACFTRLNLNTSKSFALGKERRANFVFRRIKSQKWI